MDARNIVWLSVVVRHIGGKNRRTYRTVRPWKIDSSDRLQDQHVKRSGCNQRGNDAESAEISATRENQYHEFS
jgi:hypothetical protein